MNHWQVAVYTAMGRVKKTCGLGKLVRQVASRGFLGGGKLFFQVESILMMCSFMCTVCTPKIIEPERIQSIARK